MIRLNPCVALVTLLLFSETISFVSAEDLEPGDPFASLDGLPMYVGEINLVLGQRIGVENLDRVGIAAKQATATLLVRRHLAMNALKRRGGDALSSSISRRVESFASEAKRQGTSIGELARLRKSNEEAMVADIAWTAAWSAYLKSKMTQPNLRRYFDSHRKLYAGGRFDVSQIFVKLDISDAQSVAATSERMRTLVEEIRSSDSITEAFADAAREYSVSPSADDGGHVGWVEKDGDLPSELMLVVRETSPGSVSDPLHSPLGMHIVMVNKSEPGTGTFEDLADQAPLRRDAANALFDALVASETNAKVVWFADSLNIQSQ